jgi:hypothetical protein
MRGILSRLRLAGRSVENGENCKNGEKKKMISPDQENSLGSRKRTIFA